MRYLSFLFLLAFAGIVGLFAWQNRQDATLTFFEWSVTADMAVIMLATFVAGMLSGWIILGILRRSVHRSAQLLHRQPARA